MIPSNRSVFLLLLFVCIGLTTTSAQENKSRRLSPERETKATLGDLVVTIRYGSPSVRGRHIWGGLVPYGEVWRTGANEATIIEFSDKVLINGQLAPAGRYSLFTIPNEKEWTFILNKEADQWGAFNYRKQDDVLRIDARPAKLREAQEEMLFEITTKADKAAQVDLKWENLMVGFQLERPRS